MRAVIMHGPHDVRVEDRADPAIIEPTDAVIRLAATCVCGSDLWSYRGTDPVTEPTPMGHEHVGLVPSLLAASDVLGTGWFAAVATEAGPAGQWPSSATVRSGCWGSSRPGSSEPSASSR